MPVSSPHVQSHGKHVCAMMCAYDVLVGRGAWAFEVRGRHVEAWCACRGKRCIAGTAECVDECDLYKTYVTAYYRIQRILPRLRTRAAFAFTRITTLLGRAKPAIVRSIPLHSRVSAPQPRLSHAALPADFHTRHNTTHVRIVPTTV